MQFHLGNRARQILRYVGIAFVGLVTFVLALQLSFPYNRVKDKIVEVLSEKYDVTIGDVERGLKPGRMYFKNVSLRTRPTKADEVASTFFVQRLEVSLGLFALLRGAASVDLDAAIGKGHLSGNISLSKGKTEIDLDGSSLDAADLPTREALGLPLTGKIAFAFKLDLPNEKSKSGKVAPDWTKAEGEISFDCPSGCTFGDGKTKLRPKLKNARSAAFAGEGIEFGKVNIDSMLARVTIKNGELELTQFEAKSPDGELHVDYSMALAPEFGESTVAGCLRFKGSEALLKREPKTHAAISTTGAQLGPDNLFHIRLDGKFKDMKRLAQTCGAAAKNINMDDMGGGGTTTHSRPNLTVQPDEPLHTATPPPPPAPPPAAPADAAAPVPIPGPTEEHTPAAPPPPAAGEPAPGSGTAGAGGAGATPPSER